MADQRTRLTERGYNPKTGSFAKSADPYLMNQERRPGANPSAVKYESGNPSSWAEDVTPVDVWKKEYAAGRDESNVGNFLPNTFVEREQSNPVYDKASSEQALKAAASDRQAAFEEARKTAHQALHLAHALFPKANQSFLTDQARDFMSMGRTALETTIARIIGAGEEKEEVEDKKEVVEEKAEKEEKESKKSSVDSYESELASIKQASDAHLYTDVIASLETRIAQLKKAEAEVEDKKEVEEKEKSEKEASLKNRLAALNAGLGKLTKAAGEDKKEVEEKEEPEEKAEKESKKGRNAAEESEAEVKKEEGEEKEASNYEIELISSELDSLPSDGDLLDTIFTSSDKTASNNGKRGVRSLGGVGKVASENSVTDLSALWKSDPDVSANFR